MTGELERRYRTLLRLLPAPYRRAWEDEMVTEFLESMRPDDPEDAEYLADYGRPPLPEVASVLALAVRLRLGVTGAPTRYLAWGDAIALVALLGLLAHAVFGLTGVGFRLWAAGELPLLPGPRGQWVLPMPESVWQTAWQLSGLLELPPLLALLYGFRRQALALAGLAMAVNVASTLVLVVGESRQGWGPVSVSVGASLLFDLFLLAALAAFHAGARPVPRRPWLIGLAAGVVFMPALWFVGQAIVLRLSAPAAILFDGPALWCLAVLAGGLVHMVARGVGRSAPAWSLALAVLAGAVVALRLLDLLRYVVFDVPGRPWVLVLGLAQAAAVAAVGVALALLARRTVRASVDGSAARDLSARTPAAGG